MTSSGIQIDAENPLTEQQHLLALDAAREFDIPARIVRVDAYRDGTHYAIHFGEGFEYRFNHRTGKVVSGPYYAEYPEKIAALLLFRLHQHRRDVAYQVRLCDTLTKGLLPAAALSIEVTSDEALLLGFLHKHGYASRVAMLMQLENGLAKGAVVDSLENRQLVQRRDDSSSYYFLTDAGSALLEARQNSTGT